MFSGKAPGTLRGIVVKRQRTRNEVRYLEALIVAELGDNSFLLTPCYRNGYAKTYVPCDSCLSKLTNKAGG